MASLSIGDGAAFGGGHYSNAATAIRTPVRGCVVVPLPAGRGVIV